MELAALALWILVALIGAPLAAAAVLGPASLVIQAMCAVGGLVMYALYVILDGGQAFLWIGFGLAALGALSMLPGIAWLVSPDRAANRRARAALRGGRGRPGGRCRSTCSAPPRCSRLGRRSG